MEGGTEELSNNWMCYIRDGNILYLIMAEEKLIHILYAKISQDIPEEVYKRSLIVLPDTLRDKHFRYKRWQDRASNLYSKILLLRGLEKCGYDDVSLVNLHYTEFARPFLPGTVDFNISHSGEYILCAVADGSRVGIDIEEIKPVDFSDFTDLMSRDQWQSIRESSNPLKAFFTFWAIKESIIKADGRGLSIPLNDIIITKNTAFYDTKWHLKELQIDEGYCTSLATDHENPRINLDFVDLARL